MTAARAALGMLVALLSVQRNAIGAPVQPADWNCQGKIVPPIGYRPEVAFVRDKGTSNAAEEAVERARKKLLDSLCQHECAELAAKITVWKTAAGGGHACAMVVIEERAYLDWKSGLSTTDTVTKLVAVSADLLGPPAPEGKRGPAMSLVIDKVIDEGIPGGQRAVWFRDQMAAALRRRGGIQLVEPPRGWAGDGVPRGASAVLFADVVKRREGQRNMLEVTWKARLPRRGDFEMRTAAGVLVPEGAAPEKRDPPVAQFAPEKSLSLRLEAGSGGSLCPGQQTQLYLKSTEDRYVQVYDIYGIDQNKALLIFPNEARPDGHIRAGETIPIGPPEGFVAAPVAGSEAERFLVLAAPTRAEIGPTMRYTGECRLAPAEAARVLASAAVSGSVVRTGDGFRIWNGPHCRSITPPRPEELEALEKHLAKIRICR